MKPSTLFEAIFAEGRDAQTAVVCDRGSITYGELKAETTRLARILTALDVRNGERVAILLHDSPEFIAAFIGVQAVGALAVPINMALLPNDQRAILEDCTARTVIIEATLCNTLLTHALDTLRFVENVVVVPRDDNSSVEIQGRRIVDLTSTPALGPAPDFQATPSAEERAFILYTSGSTGEPKGAVHSQSDAFYTNQTFCKQVLDLRPNDRLFSSSRLPFAYGLGNSFSFPLLNGCTSILSLPKPTPEIIRQTLHHFAPTIFFGVPVVYNLLLEYHRRTPIDCSSLRLCISAGEALPPHLGEAWQDTFGVEVLDGIGSTEMLHMWMSNFSGAVRYGSSGKLLAGYEARLLDQDGHETASDAEGNLWVKGASAASGYWQRPETTARTFVDGWVRTGDIYRHDDQGYWFHMGRSDDCFKSSGQWVSPVEVESVLLRQGGVHAAAVVEELDKNGLPGPCAFIVCGDEASNKVELESSLKLLAEQSLARFKRPRRYLFVSELPYTATGKVQRFKLREQLRK